METTEGTPVGLKEMAWRKYRNDDRKRKIKFGSVLLVTGMLLAISVFCSFNFSGYVFTEKNETSTRPSTVTEVNTTSRTTTAPGNVIFITGGWGTDNSTEVLDPTGSCSRLSAPLRDKRFGHSMSILRGDLVLCGGLYTDTSCISARSPGGPWVHHSNLTAERYHHASVATRDAIHVFAGGSSGERDTAETLEVDGARTWKKHQLPYTIGYGACAVEIQNIVYLTGGWDAMTQTWKWNTQQQWTRLADMDGPGRLYHGCAVVTEAGKSLILVAGGWDDTYLTLRTSAIYDIQANTWRSTGQLNQARRGGRMVNVGTGVYMLGGYDGSNGLKTVEKFDVATNEWLTTNFNMKQSRRFFAAVSVDRADFC